MADEWIGLVQTTAPRYLKGAMDMTIRKRLWLSLLRKKGRIILNGSGTSIKWQARFDEAPVESRGDNTPVTYANRDLYRQLELDWREYLATNKLTKRQRTMNDGNEALVKLYSEILPNLVKDIDSKLGTEMYVDGYATGNSNRFCGFDSFTGTSTTVVGDKVAYPSDTYAGRSTAPGATAGTWSADMTTKPNAALATDWPEGSGTTSYDWLSPKLLNWSSTAWTGTNTWASTCELVLRQAKIWCTATSGVDGTPELVVLAPALYNDFVNKQQSRVNIWAPHKEADDLGFPDALMFDGMAIHYEYGVPANCGYGHNFMEQQLNILGSDFYKSEGPTWDPFTNSYLFQVGVMGNMQFTPKAHFKVKNYAAS